MEKLCLGCMQMKESIPICEHCGFDEQTENLPHQLPMGTLLQNQYLIGRVLGQGGFGITYMGWDQHLSIPVAIKEYYPTGIVQRHTKISTDVQNIKENTQELFARHKDRFLKEARTLAQLTQIPEIVQIKSFFSANDTAYIVMEYVQGTNLKEHMKKLGHPMSEAEALAIMEPVLKALQKVHDQGLIHRDISPDNIMLPSDGGIKLIDFGTVRYMDNSGRSQATEAVLKPGFAPMEQYNAKGNLGTWTDVYAVSATFHYLLTGKIPADVHTRLDEGDDLPLLRNNTGISHKVVSALERGLKIRYQERVQTISELYQLLYSDAPAKQEKPAVSRKRRSMGIVAFAAAAIAAVALLLPLGPATPTEETPEETYVLDAAAPAAAETLSMDEQLYQEAELLEASGAYGKAAIAFGKLSGYKDARERSLAMWKKVPYRKTISLSIRNDKGLLMLHGLRENGTIAVDCVQSDKISDEEISRYLTSSYRDIVSIHDVIGLRIDGTLALPDASFPYYQELSAWTDLVAISVPQAPYADFFLGLKSDGTVVSAGANKYGECDVSGWTDIVAIHAGEDCSFGVRSDGTALATGRNRQGMCEIRDWTDIRAITSYDLMTYGLRYDGTIIGAGSNYTQSITIAEQQKDVLYIDGPHILLDGGVLRLFHSNWKDIVAFTWCNPSDGNVTVALQADGSFLCSRGRDGSFARTQNWTDIQIPSDFIPTQE